MSNERGPHLFVDEKLDGHVAEGVKALNAYIRKDPARAAKIIKLYAKNTEAGDEWSGVLAGKDEKRLPFRLTAALGTTANRDTVRYVTFDETTEDIIESNPQIGGLLEAMRKTGDEDEKESISRQIGLLRLGIYADVLAVAATADVSKDVDGDAATA
jgi:hypothetical protein